MNPTEIEQHARALVEKREFFTAREFLREQGFAPDQIENKMIIFSRKVIKCDSMGNYITKFFNECGDNQYLMYVKQSGTIYCFATLNQAMTEFSLLF